MKIAADAAAGGLYLSLVIFVMAYALIAVVPAKAKKKQLLKYIKQWTVYSASPAIVHSMRGIGGKSKYMRPADFNIMTVIHAAVGKYQCSDSLDELYTGLYPDIEWMTDVTAEELALFDSKVFQCERCGWWFRQENRDTSNENEWTCDECSE